MKYLLRIGKSKDKFKNLDLAFADKIKVINFHNSFVPENVKHEESNILDYWNDENPDI